MLAIFGLLGLALAGMALIPGPETAEVAEPEDMPEDDLEGDPGTGLLQLIDGPSGPSENVVLFDGAGDGTLQGGAGADYLDGEEGRDTLHGAAGDDILHGGTGDDSLYGGDGADALFGHVGDDLMEGGAGHDTLSGGDGADRIDGGTGDDSLQGSLGDDTLVGGAGADVLHGGAGADLVDGRSGEEAGAEADYLNGGAGDDRIEAGAGDIASGGTGADTFGLVSGTEGAAVVQDFDPAEDRILLRYAGESPPEVEIAATPEGTELRANGSLVAFFPGLAGFDAALVDLAPR